MDAAPPLPNNANPGPYLQAAFVYLILAPRPQGQLDKKCGLTRSPPPQPQPRATHRIVPSTARTRFLPPAPAPIPFPQTPHLYAVVPPAVTLPVVPTQPTTTPRPLLLINLGDCGLPPRLQSPLVPQLLVVQRSHLYVVVLVDGLHDAAHQVRLLRHAPHGAQQQRDGGVGTQRVVLASSNYHLTPELLRACGGSGAGLVLSTCRARVRASTRAVYYRTHAHLGYGNGVRGYPGRLLGPGKGASGA